MNTPNQSSKKPSGSLKKLGFAVVSAPNTASKAGDAARRSAQRAVGTKAGSKAESKKPNG